MFGGVQVYQLQTRATKANIVAKLRLPMLRSSSGRSYRPIFTHHLMIYVPCISDVPSTLEADLVNGSAEICFTGVFGFPTQNHSTSYQPPPAKCTWVWWVSADCPVQG